MTVEDAAENQVASGNRGFERISKQVREVIRLRAASAQSCQRMQEDGQVQRLNARKDLFEQWVVEVATFDIRSKVDTAYAGQFARPIEFIDGVIGEEHW